MSYHDVTDQNRHGPKAYEFERRGAPILRAAPDIEARRARGETEEPEGRPGVSRGTGFTIGERSNAPSRR